MTAALQTPRPEPSVDRRRRGTPMMSRYWLRGRRRAGRRAGEAAGIYVDRYEVGEIALVAALLVMSAVDLLATGIHLLGGGSEANPLMALALQEGGGLGFATAKLLATGVGALVLLLHVRFPGVGRSLRILVGIYALVMLWHILVSWDRLSLL